jgi:uncharacterized membrane protein
MSQRVQSIDLLRGIVMVIMVLDHSRTFFHENGFTENATDLSTTTPLLFLTRWITHFCAPVFIFLSGTSIYLMRNKSRKERSIFVFKRGLWLLFLSLTVVAFAWWFDLSMHYLALDVIWVIGLCMVLLAGILYLPYPVILFFGIITVALHNLLDKTSFDNGIFQTLIWDLFHQEGLVKISNSFSIYVVYPLIPWIGVMCLGYCLGKLYQQDLSAEKRKKFLFFTGIGCVLLFVLIRSFNSYGEPGQWKQYSSGLFSVMSFINTTKYPPSLLYLLMTIGPSLIFLSLAESFRNKVAKFFIVYGRVPMFFYLIHLYLLHLVAFIITIAFYSWDQTMQSLKTIPDFPEGYGFSLLIVYLVWFITVFVLYPICKWYNNYKSTHKQWWLGYL